MELQTCDQNADESSSTPQLEHIGGVHKVCPSIRVEEAVTIGRSCDSQECWMKYCAKTRLAFQVLRPVVPASMVVRDSRRVIVS